MPEIAAATVAEGKAEHGHVWHRWQAHAHEWPWQWQNMVMNGIGGGRMLLNGPGSGSSHEVP